MPSGSSCACSFRLRPSAFPRRPAVTLVELLIVMVILAILGAAVLGTATAAMEAARDKRTQSLITKIHTLVMEQYASYETRRVDLHPQIVQAINGMSGNVRGQMLADARLLGVRELMKFEMPDRWSDVLGGPVANNPQSSAVNNPQILASSPALRQAYYRRFVNLDTTDVDVVQSNQGAECLYMIVMFATGDGEARTLFAKQDIGDTDGDGANEFIDGWGQPIQFIRWPAGFVQQSTLMSGDADADHDPFDVYRRDSTTITTPQASDYPAPMQQAMGVIRNRNKRVKPPDPTMPAIPPFLTAFRLTPLIYSAGGDGDSDLAVTPGKVTELDPYRDYYGDDGKTQLGWPYDQEGDGQGWQDNIHNHTIEY